MGNLHMYLWFQNLETLSAKLRYIYQEKKETAFLDLKIFYLNKAPDQQFWVNL